MMTWVNSVGREEKGPRILSEVFGQAAQMRFGARNPFWELQYKLDKLFTRPWTMPIQRMNVVDGGEKIPEWATFEPPRYFLAPPVWLIPWPAFTRRSGDCVESDDMDTS